MSLKENLHNEMIKSLKSTKTMKDENELEFAKIRVNVLRAAKKEITDVETSGKSRSELNDSEVISVLRKMIKQRDESAEIFSAQNETARQMRELCESQMLREFVPTQLDEEATRLIVQEIVKEGNLEGMRAIGQVMGKLKSRSDIDGSVASRIAREILA